MSDVWIVLTTFGDRESAGMVARELVEKGLVACVNLMSEVTSIYRWEGKLCEEGEVLAVMKTTEERYPELEESLRHLHPYEVPEVLALPAAAGSDMYLDFVKNAVK
ncbi:MAG: divalent-cation tolerance protein CutA [Roseibacillus sp.]